MATVPTTILPVVPYVIVDDSDPRIQYTSEWDARDARSNTDSSSALTGSNLNGTEHLGNPGAVLTFPFNGKSYMHSDEARPF